LHCVFIHAPTLSSINISPQPSFDIILDVKEYRAGCAALYSVIRKLSTLILLLVAVYENEGRHIIVRQGQNETVTSVTDNFLVIKMILFGVV
jgi:hypothetical protein